MSNSSDYVISGGYIANNSIGSDIQSSISGEDNSNINLNNGNLIINRASIVNEDQFVFDGDVVSGITIISGNQTVYGGRVESITISKGSQIVRGGNALSTTVYMGDQSVYGGEVANANISYGGQFVQGGIVTNTTILNGNQIVSGGTVDYVTINMSGSLVVSQNIYGGDIFNTTFHPMAAWENMYGTGGTQRIFSGNVANTIFEKGGATQIILNGNVSNTSFANGFNVYHSTTVISKVAGGTQVISGGSVFGTSFGQEGSQNISGGSVLNTSFQYSGTQIISGGNVSNTSFVGDLTSQIVHNGSVFNTNFLQGGSQNISGGYISNTSFVRGGIQDISGGNVISSYIIGYSVNYVSSYMGRGRQIISGGSVSNTSMINGTQEAIAGNIISTNIQLGSQIVYNSATVRNTSVTSGTQTVSGGQVTSTNLVNGSQNIYKGNVTSTNITSGIQIVSGGNVISTNIINGSQLTYSGGSVNQTTITSGAQIIVSGAFVENTSIFNGAVQSINSGAIVSHTTLLGSHNISGAGYTTSQLIFPGGIASSTLIDGGYQRIYSGAIANDTTVHNGTIYALDGATVGNLTLNSGGFLDVFTDTKIQGVVMLNQGGSAQIQTSNGGAINLVGDDNGGLTIIGDPSILNTDNNVSVTTQIQGFSGVDAKDSDAISLQYNGLQNSKLSNVTFPDNDHITITMDNGFSLTLNIVGIKQTGYSIQSPSDGASGLVLTVCFLSGTQIKTQLGVKNIEELQAGDFVTTYDWAQKKYVEREVTWVGKKYCRVNKSLPDDMAGYPVRIVKDAIAKNIPYKDLLVTAEHCLFFEDKFIPARMLVNGSTIYYDYSITSYEYYHLETQDHAVIIADGVRTESYLDTGNRHAFNRDQKVIETSFQSAKDWVVDAAAPLVVARDVVEPLHHELNQRAKELGAYYKGRHVQLVNDSDLHLVTDQGQVIRNKRVSGKWVTFMVPSTVGSVWINSNRSRLCDVIGPFVDNRHFLGVLVGEVMVFADNKNEFLNILREEEELEGWHAKQKQAGRWTTGKALLPIKSKHLVDNSVIYISLQILSEGPYVELVTEEEITLVS